MKLAIKCFQWNVFIFKYKRRTGYKYCKIELLSGVISHGASNEPLVQRSIFAKIVNGYNLYNIFAKTSIIDVRLDSKYAYVNITSYLQFSRKIWLRENWYFFFVLKVLLNVLQQFWSLHLYQKETPTQFLVHVLKFLRNAFNTDTLMAGRFEVHFNIRK